RPDDRHDTPTPHSRGDNSAILETDLPFMSQMPLESKDAVHRPRLQTAETSRVRYHRLVAGAVVVDALVVACALLPAQWIRFETPLAGIGVPAADDFRAVDYL